MIGEHLIKKVSKSTRNSMKKVKALTRRARKSDFAANNAIIRESFIAVLKRNKGLRPSVDELSSETGLSGSTIKKHLKELDFKDLMSENACFKLLTDDVVLAVYRTAIKGNPSAQKLWFQVVEGWSEKQVTEHSGRIETPAPDPPVILHIG